MLIGDILVRLRPGYGFCFFVRLLFFSSAFFDLFAGPVSLSFIAYRNGIVP